MQWLNELPFADNRVLQIGFLAACGIAALIALAIVYRLTFAHRLRVPGGRTRQPRLGLVDAFSLDGQRQLVLIRRDNIEHLVMIGGPNDVLVESQINRAVVPARESNQASPLLVPSTPARRTEVAALPASPTVAEPPPKVAAKVAAPPPAARTGPGCAGRPDRGAARFRSRPLPSRRPLPFPINRPFLSKPQRPNRRAQPPLRRPRHKQRSPPDRRRRIPRPVRRTRRAPRNRARPCPRRSSPPTPRPIAGRRFALRKQLPQEARAIPWPHLLSRLRRRAARRRQNRQSLARKRSPSLQWRKRSRPRRQQ